MALLCVHMSDISEQEKRHIPWASWREKTVNPSTSNTAPHLHSDSTQSEAWKQEASVQRDQRDTAQGQAETD